MLNMVTRREALARAALRDHGNSVVSVVTHKKDEETLAGSGFIIRATGDGSVGLVITCYHVVQFFEPSEQDKLRIRLPMADEECEGEILFSDDYTDLASIGVPELPSGYPALKFNVETPDLAPGTEVVLLAYYHPENLAGTNSF